jgi:two-component system CAI-1 autoinducer sensor kinase/phosphatase CqsS
MTNQNLNANLEQIKNLKSLAASIAHETKNPLSAIGGFCRIIRRNLDEVIEYLDLIAVSSWGLSIIEMILQNIRDEEIDTSNFVGLSIANVVDLAIKEYAFESDFERGLVSVDLEDDFNFKGDETLMIFVLFNLIKNSLYYRAKINIWLNSDKKCLYFRDNGVGIAQDKLEFIFDSFFTSDKEGGIGLGLPFCRRVMRAFGGDISCKSGVGEGVEFCLRFK